MNNLTIRTQIVECEVAYYKIRHTNPVLAEVDMELYHSLPPVQVLLGEMTRLESLVIRLDATASDTTATTPITAILTPTPTTTTTTSTIVTLTPTADQPQPKIV